MAKQDILDSLNNILSNNTGMSVIDKLEQDLDGEYEAINLYEQHIAIINEPEIKAKLIEIKNEEEIHVKELKELIEKFKNKYLLL